MKKRIAIGLALFLLLSGCGQQEAPATEAPTTQPTVTETTEATTAPTETEAPKPECKDITVMGENIPLIRLFLDQGAQAEVTGYQDALARVTAGGKEGFVETQYLRFPDEAFEPFTGYARWNAGFYRDAVCLGDPQQTLSTNTKLEVLEELDNCYYVNLDGTKGYVQKAQLSKWVVQSLPAEPGSSSSGGGGGSSGGAQDGGNITLMDRPAFVLLADEVKTGTATAKVPRTPMLARCCLLGENLQMVVSQGFAESIPGYVTILEPDGTYAYISESWVLLPDQSPFEAWEGYAGYNCKLYKNETLSGKEATIIYANTKVTVLWDTGTVSYIQTGEETYYAASSTLRRTPIVVAPAEESSSHSSGGGGSSGGGDMWTPAKK